MHPTIAGDLARSRIADFHAAAAADRRLLAARRRPDDVADPAAETAVVTPFRADPTGLVRRLLGRLRPAVAP